MNATQAVQRAAESMAKAPHGPTYGKATRALAAALDVEEMARAIHDGPNAMAQYRRAGITEHSYDDCPYSDQYQADAEAIRAAMLGGGS